MKKEKILIIRHGAFGDFILSFGPFRTIRNAWPNAEITLLTTTPYVKLAEKSGLFDTVWVDTRPKFFQIKALFHLWRKLLSPRFSWVYDLQTSNRSSLYHKFFLLGGQRPNWSGIAFGCSHPDINSSRSSIHTQERQKEQLRFCGLENYCPPDFSFLTASTKEFSIKKPYILFVPGCSPHRPEKRWPHYSDLAKSLIKLGYTCVALGSAAELDLIKNIQKELNNNQLLFFKDLSGKTSFNHIAELARHASGAVGNDTGPMHLISAVNCPSLVLFSGDSDPKRCAPRGDVVSILQKPCIKDLPYYSVLEKLTSILR